MYLKSVELVGFKSFARKTALEFSASITAIVGPNGSGKSNIAEAFRFVLGEQSFKSMRGKRGEDLIFNGSVGVDRANRAGVKMTFDNSSRLLDIDFDEVVIERAVHRDGVNQYLINGSAVRLRDVIELLAGAHIGSSGHHIISQGEADRILSAGAKERRVMIEDALGLKVYQYKRQESEKKLEKTRENITHVESLRKEIAPHLRFLSRQVEKIQKALVMREQLKDFYKEYLKREALYIASERENILLAENGPVREERELSEKLEKAKAVLAERGEKDESRSAREAIEARLARVGEKKESATREIGRIEGQVAFVKKQIEAEARKAESESALSVPKKEMHALKEDVEAGMKDIADAADDAERVRGTARRLFERVQSFVSRFSASAGDGTDRLHEELERLAQSLEEAQKELGVVQEEERLGRADYAALQRQVEAAQDKARDAERDIFAIMTRRQEVQAALGEIRARKERLGRAEEEFREELQEGAVLVGREILDYEEYIVKDKGGRDVPHTELLEEERRAQEDRRKALERQKIRLEELGGASSEEILKEHEEVKGRDEFLAREIDDLARSAESLDKLILELDEKLQIEFTAGIAKINKEFQIFFELMFGGGSASLAVEEKKPRRKMPEAFSAATLGEELEHEQEETEGIDIKISLPRKKIRGLEMLSGGERTLTSIALIFAMSQVNPPPFLVLDETDAALDEANSRRYGDMIETLAQHSQLVLITHNRETMGRAGILYGVTMGADGISKTLSVKFDEAVAVAK